MNQNMTTAQVLDWIDLELAQRERIMSKIDEENYQVFGASVVLQTFQICQYMMCFFALLKGLEADENGVVVDSSYLHPRPMVIQKLFSQLDGYIPQKYAKLLMSMRKVRNKAAHMQSFSQEDYLDAFSSFGTMVCNQ